MVSLTLCSIFVLTIWISTSSAQNGCGYNTSGLQGTIRGYVQEGGHEWHSKDCEWTITVPPVYRIALKIKEMDFDGLKDGFCSTHWVAIESLTESGVGLYNHGVFCGNKIYSGRTITSVQNQLRIKHYYYGSSTRSNGYFFLTYEAVRLDPLDVVKYYVENTELKNHDLPRAVTSLFLADETYFKSGNAKAENITDQFRLQLGEDLIKNSTRPMTAGDIALHVSGLLAVCINPRSSFGVDLVYNLRKLLNNITGIPNPNLYLTLCNAGADITDDDVEKLTAVVENPKPEMFWLDYQAMAVLALVCIRDRNLGYDLNNTLEEAKADIISYQLQDGGFGSLQTTSLVVQALTAVEANETEWNRVSAVHFLNRAKLSNGSFASLYDVYALTPVISRKTLLYLNASKCGFSEDDVSEIRTNLSKPIQLVYSVWVGDHIDISNTVTLKAPKGTKFFDFMRLAADQNEKFKFKWINMKNSPYVYQIGGLNNDPSSGRYWTLYTGTHAMNLEYCSKGLQQYVPQNGEMAVMWYKSVNVGS